MITEAPRLAAAPKPARLAALKARLGRLEGRAAPAFHAPAPDDPGPAPTLNELVPEAYFDVPAAFTLLAALAARAAAGRPGPILLALCGAAMDFGLPCPEALAALGAPADRLILARARDAKGALWALEEGARTPGLACAAAATLDDRFYGLTPSRRLILAAEQSGVPILALRAAGSAAPTAARRRWRVAAAPGAPASWLGADGLPGLGARRWRIAPARMGDGGAWFEVEWNETALCFDPPAALVGRPGAAPERRVRAA